MLRLEVEEVDERMRRVNGVFEVIVGISSSPAN